MMKYCRTEMMNIWTSTVRVHLEILAWGRSVDACMRTLRIIGSFQVQLVALNLPVAVGKQQTGKPLKPVLYCFDSTSVYCLSSGKFSTVSCNNYFTKILPRTTHLSMNYCKRFWGGS